MNERRTIATSQSLSGEELASPPGEGMAGPQRDAVLVRSLSRARTPTQLLAALGVSRALGRPLAARLYWVSEDEAQQPVSLTLVAHWHSSPENAGFGGQVFRIHPDDSVRWAVHPYPTQWEIRSEHAPVDSWMRELFHVDGGDEACVAPIRHEGHWLGLVTLLWERDGLPSHLDDGACDALQSLLSLALRALPADDGPARKTLIGGRREAFSEASHELRTPLTSIRASLGLLASGVAGALPPRATSMLSIALSNTERLLRLVNDILDFDRLDSGHTTLDRRTLDMCGLAESAVEANGGFAAQFGVELRIVRPEQRVTAYGDPDRLLQVLANLISNAVKYSRAGSVVSLCIGASHGQARIAVHNDGPPIPDEFRPLVFERFSRAEQGNATQIHGTGLGLAIAKTIIEAHGGTIGFRSSSEEGTTFFFILPARVAE